MIKTNESIKIELDNETKRLYRILSRKGRNYIAGRQVTVDIIGNPCSYGAQIDRKYLEEIILEELQKINLA